MTDALDMEPTDLQREEAMRRLLEAADQARNTLPNRNTYRYRNIDYGNQIRVFKVFAGPLGTPIAGCLVPCTLVNQTVVPSSKAKVSIPYTALSYCWGTDNPEHEIRLFDTEDAYNRWREEDTTGALLETTLISRIFIRTNLHNALQQLRQKFGETEKKPLLLWADALCINQMNVQERTAQVSRMHDVFAQAETVFIWLRKGDQAENLSTLHFLNKILDLHELEQVVQRLKDKREGSTWRDDKLDCGRMIRLMQVEWFRRRWIIQELALARSAVVLFGLCEMPWLEFADAIALFTTKFDQVQLAIYEPTGYISLEPSISEVGWLDAGALGANALVTVMNNLFRKSSSGQIIKRLLSLELLVSTMLLAFEATDPRDTIFAVLQVAKDTSNHERHARQSGTRNNLIPWAAYVVVMVICTLHDESFTPYKDCKSLCIELIRGDLTLTALIARSGNLTLQLFIMLCGWFLCRMLVNAMLDFLSGKRGTFKIAGSIEADYRKCLTDVCAEFIEHCVQTSNSLDIICRHWSPLPEGPVLQSKIKWPSWILPITGNAFGRPGADRKVRINGDSFVGTEKGTYYTASGNLPPQYKFGIIRSAEEANVTAPMGIPGEYSESAPSSPEMAARFDGTLKVRGFQLGTIEETGQVFGPVISKEALEMCGWSKTKGASDAGLDQVWRVLVANRGPNGTNPPDWYRRACRSCLEWYNKQNENTFNTNTLKDMKNTPKGKVDFLKRVQQVLYNRNIITAISSLGVHYVGIGPLKSKSGDIVCIFYGCSVPVVLSSLPNGKYKFLGESYIHGIMDGEAVEPAFPRGREQWFKLC